MSAGHRHRKPNRLSHTRELPKLLSRGGAPELMQRWNHFDFDHDIVYLCGYNIWGTTRYADRDFVHALYDPEYAKQILGEPIDTGMSPDDTLWCCLWHEAVEKVLLDADNPIDIYEEAHEYASAAEDEAVEKRGGNPLKYNRGLEKIITWCERKPLVHVPHDYACAPMLDEPDKDDKRHIQDLERLGIADAFKVGKKPVHYGSSVSEDQCGRCEHWLGGREVKFHISPCGKVDGLVRDSHWCSLFEERHPAMDLNAHARWRQSATQPSAAAGARTGAGGAKPPQ